MMSKNLKINTENRGKKAKVKVFSGNIVERIVWEQNNNVVYLCTNRVYKELIADGSDFRPIGFPILDVNIEI